MMELRVMWLAAKMGSLRELQMPSKVVTDPQIYSSMILGTKG